MFKKKNQTPPDRTTRMRQPTPTRNINSSAVFSYHSSRAARPGATGRQQEPQQPAAVVARRKKPFSMLNRGPVIGMLLVGVVLVSINLFLNDKPDIVPVSTASSAIFLQDKHLYETAAQNAVSKSFLSRNKLTINARRIASDLEAQFPELAHVTVSVPFAGNRVKVYIEPSTPQLLLSSNNELYVVDTAGRALILAKQVPRVEQLALPVVTDQSALPVTLGKPTLPSSTVSFVTEVVNQLKAKKIDVTSLVLPQGTSELDVKVAGAPYFVKFNLRGDARAEAGTYLAVKGQLERDKKVPATYIDVRVDDRAYYR
jgi:cell division septal protein FtsQ